MSEPTCSRPGAPVRSAASIIFDLPGYAVTDAYDLPLGGRRVIVQATGGKETCPDCHTVSDRVHAWTRQKVRDLPAGGRPVEVIVAKPRMACVNRQCRRHTFTQVTPELPKRARCFTRLRAALTSAVIDAGRAVGEVAAAYDVAWWTVQSAVSTAAVAIPSPDTVPVRYLGIDEHRFARTRFFRDETTGAWQRVEPWMSTFVNLANGQVLGVVDGRGAPGISAWLAARSPAWRARIEVVAIDPSAPFRSAITQVLPDARVAVDHWHLIRLANLMVTHVRQRVAREQNGHRGRADDLAWAHRMLLLRAGDQLSERATHRLANVLHHDDPTGEIGAAWGVKERLRMLLASENTDAADTARGLLGVAVTGADMPETWRLWDTINHWWDEIETFIDTGVTNARTEAANTAIKQIKRTGRGYRNHHHYRRRILLRSARRTRRRRPLTQQGTTLKYE